MAVANGVTSNTSITQNFKEKQSGRQSSFYTYPYVVFDGSNIKENYVLFKRPIKTTDTNIPDAYVRAGNIVVAGAKLDSSGKLIPLKENETFYLKTDNSLATLGSTSNSYVFSDPVRQTLNDPSPGKFYQQSITAFKKVYGSASGKNEEQVNNIYNNLTNKSFTSSSLPPKDDSGTKPPSATPTTPTTSDPSGTAEPQLDLTNFTIRGEVENTKNFGFSQILRYPKGVEQNGQDIIKFEILEIQPRKFKSNSPIVDNRTFSEKPRGTIMLGIQPRITDTNAVSWTPDSMNAYEMAGQGLLMKFFGAKNQQEVSNLIDQGIGVVNNSESVTAGASGIAAAAVGSNNNLFSRLSGAIINPNMELLFQAPTLRDFPFSFSLTPRDEKDEAKNVRSIIRAFKQASAVQIGYKYLFLKSPFVFRISYLTPKKGNPKVYELHKSLNRIKICALTSMSVDYTPAGTYMTYDDERRTMTSYNVQLSFTELEPVYDIDYDPTREEGKTRDVDLKELDIIGY